MYMRELENGMEEVMLTLLVRIIEEVQRMFVSCLVNGIITLRSIVELW
jgi:hypothetical protein